jgi:hypothetical protein
MATIGIPANLVVRSTTADTGFRNRSTKNGGAGPPSLRRTVCEETRMTTEEVRTLLLDIANQHGVAADDNMSFTDIANKLKEARPYDVGGTGAKAEPRPRSNAAQWVAAVVGIVGALAGCAGALAAWRSSEAASTSATSAQTSAQAALDNAKNTTDQYRDVARMVAEEAQEKKLTGLQQVVVYEMLEREANPGGPKTLSFEEIKKRYNDEVIRDRKWGEDLAKQPFDANRLKLLLMNLESVGMVHRVFPGPDYMIQQSAYLGEFHRVKPVTDAKSDIIQLAFEKSGQVGIDEARNRMREAHSVTDREWALLITDLICQGLIRIEDKKLFAAHWTPKGTIPTPKKSD